MDVQVSADRNLAGIKSALAHNPDVTIRKFNILNHMFQTSETGSIGDYEDIEVTFAPVALTAFSDWVIERFVPSPYDLSEGELHFHLRIDGQKQMNIILILGQTEDNDSNLSHITTGVLILIDIKWSSNHVGLI